MGICANELRDLVIRPTLQHLGDWSEAAENLLLGTAAQESGLGLHLQYSSREGLGIYQISPSTHTNIWDNYLITDPDLASNVRGLASQHEFLAHPHAELATNLSYATAIAWMIYRCADLPIPPANDIAALAEFWEANFRLQPLDTVQSFQDNYTKFIIHNNGILAA